MARVLVPLAQGCEEMEAITIIDVLRRAGIDVVSAGLEAGPVTCSRRNVIVPDTTLDEALTQEFDMVVLPGGLPGADHLNADPRIIELLQSMHARGRYTAAICAAPKVLATAGLLDGRSATSYPGVLDAIQVPGLRITTDHVVEDDRVITSQGPGTAMDFALALIDVLAGRAKRDQVEAGLRPGM
ncbi:MAG: DJ-1/PfpI family protein [Gammaproteobacteria bacterium]|nr:DJ-1/PfpI family protein [Gammaproteobacteria bacterium]